MDEAALPKDLKKLRACLLCSLVKNASQFRKEGCDNCDHVLKMRGDPEQVLNCTSPTFDGMVAMMQPVESWVARWQRVDKFKPGMYALAVSGRLPDDAIDALQAQGIQYYPRDGTDH